MRHFFFGGKDSRTYFDFINYINRPYIAPIDVPSIKIPNRAGAISTKRNDIGIREISVGVTLMGLNDADLRTKVRALASFLIYATDQPLYFSDEVNRIYYARFVGGGDNLEEIVAMGQGELTFICFDPFAYSNAQKSILNTVQEFTLTNDGTVEAFPLFRIVTSANANVIKVKNLTTGKTFTYNALWYAVTPLIVDMNNNRVYHEGTGVSYLLNVTLDSQFFSLAVGTNNIRIETAIDGTASISSVRATWTDRFY